jgi:hypothetical protein
LNHIYTISHKKYKTLNEFFVSLTFAYGELKKNEIKFFKMLSEFGQGQYGILSIPRV